MDIDLAGAGYIGHMYHAKNRQTDDGMLMYTPISLQSDAHGR
jgi:hypothetical protein